VGADVLRVGVCGRAEKRRFDGVGEQRATASGDQVVQCGVRDGADASSRDEPGEEAFDPGA
jgi:hypothetical protein